jgi:hypothetical protein
MSNPRIVELNVTEDTIVAQLALEQANLVGA